VAVDVNRLKVTPPDPGTWLLDKIDAREQVLTCQIEQVQAEIDALSARLDELGEAIEHLRITRKTLLALADEDDARPAAPPPALPSHPAYQQILTVFADADRPPRPRAYFQLRSVRTVSAAWRSVRLSTRCSTEINASRPGDQPGLPSTPKAPANSASANNSPSLLRTRTGSGACRLPR
jgi:hypothetical protein